ncbi:MAG: hypothetical protein ACYSU0_07215 [Planctomycetota bacterium]|jgi:hypothetical protein
MPDGKNTDDSAGKRRRELIGQAVVSWGMAVLLSAVVQVVRFRFVEMFQSMYPEEIRPGFISFAEPNSTGLGFTLGRLYRFMHNLTVPYVMAFYVAAFVGAFALFRRKERGQRAQLLFEAGSLAVHWAFIAAWGISLFMPEEVSGSILRPSIGP